MKPCKYNEALVISNTFWGPDGSEHISTEAQRLDPSIKSCVSWSDNERPEEFANIFLFPTKTDMHLNRMSEKVFRGWKCKGWGRWQRLTVGQCLWVQRKQRKITTVLTKSRPWQILRSWSPETHHLWPIPFKRRVKLLLLGRLDHNSPLSLLDRPLMLLLLQYIACLDL